MKAKIEQFIEKYKSDIICAEYKQNQALKNTDSELGKISTEIHNKKMFIKDLQSLQEPTDERECNNCKKLQKELDGISFSV